MLHGAGGNAEHGLSLLRNYADEHNIILVAPAPGSGAGTSFPATLSAKTLFSSTRPSTWCWVATPSTRRGLPVGGFSDGASYALCLGLTNGDLFTHVVAFSPGFFYTEEEQGKPAVFVSHGTRDRVLPIDPCSRRLVPRLQRKGLSVNYQEFDGEHVIPDRIAADALAWFFGGKTE
jgi:pimeloyl-ACP methyl ester carboxylesterase